MSKADEKNRVDEVRREYDLRGGVRGKYAQRYAEGSNVVVLDPDVAEHFKTSEEVNQALPVVMPWVPPGGSHPQLGQT